MMNQNQTELMRHVHFFSEEIGARPIGSPANLRAAEYIQSIYRANGLEVESHTFDCPDWRDEGATLLLGDREITAHTNVYSPACVVSGEGVAVCTMDELELADLTGKIAILYGDLMNEPLTPKNNPLYPADYHHKIIRILEEKQPQAVLTANSKLGSSNRMILDWDFEIPSATVPLDSALDILSHPGDRLKLEIRTTSQPGTTETLFGIKNGTRPERIAIMAHYDTTVGTPGALDNASGMALVLELAKRLAKADLQTGVEFIAWSEHEYGGFSDPHYVEQRGESFYKTLAAINFDAAGFLAGTNTIMFQSGSEEMQAEVDKIVGRFPGMAWTESWPQSNHSTFSWRGIPAVAFSSPASWPLTHLPLDTEKLVSPRKLEEVLLVAEAIVFNLQDKPLEWTRER